MRAWMLLPGAGGAHGVLAWRSTCLPDAGTHTGKHAAAPTAHAAGHFMPRGTVIAAGCWLWATCTALFASTHSLYAAMPICALNGIGEWRADLAAGRGGVRAWVGAVLCLRLTSDQQWMLPDLSSTGGSQEGVGAGATQDRAPAPAIPCPCRPGTGHSKRAVAHC